MEYHCLKRSACVFHTLNGACSRRQSIIAVDESGRYANQSKASLKYPILIDLNSCVYQGEFENGQVIRRVKRKIIH